MVAPMGQYANPPRLSTKEAVFTANADYFRIGNIQSRLPLRRIKTPIIQTKQVSVAARI